MRALGPALWGILCTAFLTNSWTITLWIWGVVIGGSVLFGIYRAIKQNRERKEEERRMRERAIIEQKRKFPSFNERLLELGFVENEEGNYENYINRNSVTISFLEGGSMLVEIYNDYKDEEFKKEYKSPVPVMRKLCSLYD